MEIYICVVKQHF